MNYDLDEENEDYQYTEQAYQPGLTSNKKGIIMWQEKLIERLDRLISVQTELVHCIKSNDKIDVDDVSNNTELRKSIWKTLDETLRKATNQRQAIAGLWGHRLLTESDAFLLELTQLSASDLAEEALLVGEFKGTPKENLEKWFRDVLSTIKNVLVPKNSESKEGKDLSPEDLHEEKSLSEQENKDD